MNSVQFKNIDLNLFRVLLMLLDHRSVSRAAEELALTPSAVSHALNRLRTALDDPLFERGGGGLVPTARALEIGRSVRPAIDQLREAVDRSEFEPGDTEREFVVAAGTYAVTVILPLVIDRIAMTAPGVRLRVRRIEEQSVEDLELGRFDVLLSTSTGLKPGVEWTPLLQDEMVWIARKGHPTISPPLKMDMLVRAQHVILEKMGHFVGAAYPEARQFFEETPELHDASAAAAGRLYRSRTSSTGAIVTDVLHAMAFVRKSDLVSLSLRRLAEQDAEGLQVLTAPHATPAVEIGAMYLRARQRDPGFNWLMEQLEAVVQAL